MATEQAQQGPTREQQAETAKAETRSGAKTKRRGEEKGPFVLWTGASAGVGSIRRINKTHWGQLNIRGDDVTTIEFNVQNGFRYPKSAFSGEQLDYLLGVDGHFVLVDAEGNPAKDEDGE